MNYQKYSLFVLVGAIVVFAITSIGMIQINDISAEETEDKGYTFAEDTKITGVFYFKGNIVEMSDFEVFGQEGGWNNFDTPVFVLEKIVSDGTPILHQATDVSHKYSGTTGLDHQFKDFNVDIIISNGKPTRQLEYVKCDITNYNIKTLFDKEEGWTTSKGFAVTEKYEFTCDGYFPFSPSYEELNKSEFSKTTSSLDLRETDTWSDVYKYTNP